MYARQWEYNITKTAPQTIQLNTKHIDVTEYKIN